MSIETSRSLIESMVNRRFRREKPSGKRFPMPPQEFEGNSAVEIPGNENYEETVKAYQRQYQALFERMAGAQVDIKTLLRQPDVEIAHLCSGYPAKAEGLWDFLQSQGIVIQPSQIINVDFSPEVHRVHAGYPLTARMRFQEQSVFDFLHQYHPEDKLVIGLAVTVTGIVIVQTVQHVSRYVNKPLGLKFGFFTTQQVNDYAEPELWRYYQDAQMVWEWWARFGARSKAEVIDFNLDYGRWTEEWAWYVKPKADALNYQNHS